MSQVIIGDPGKDAMSTLDESSVDEWDEWANDYDAIVDADPQSPEVESCVDLLEGYCPGGRAIELAAGTGRIAIPLAKRGVTVAALDASASMLERLVSKPDGHLVDTVVADMTSFELGCTFDLAYIVYSGLFFATSQHMQLATLRCAHAHLAPGGVLVVDAFVPNLCRFTEGSFVGARGSTGSLTVLEVARIEQCTQTITSSYLGVGNDGTFCHSSRIRYAWPSEIDLMAEHIGFDLERRCGDWDGREFDEAATRHISVFRRRP